MIICVMNITLLNMIDCYFNRLYITLISRREIVDARFTQSLSYFLSFPDMVTWSKQFI